MLAYTSWNRSNNLYQPAFAKGFTQWSIGSLISLGDWWVLLGTDDLLPIYLR